MAEEEKNIEADETEPTETPAEERPAEAPAVDRAQADRPPAEAGERAGPPPGAPRRRRLGCDGQDDRRQGRGDQDAPALQEGDPPFAEVPRARRAEPGEDRR